jgi:hypothetical protein
MATSRAVRLAIELQAVDRRVAGRLTDERGEHPFGSWLDLLTLLEAARLRSLVLDRPQAQPLQTNSRRAGRGAT